MRYDTPEEEDWGWIIDEDPDDFCEADESD
jgi:hypothetical protein